jgi:hypothetical protein
MLEYEEDIKMYLAEIDCEDVNNLTIVHSVGLLISGVQPRVSDTHR